MVFDFTGGTPGTRVEYGTLYEEGRGNPVPVAGAATLSVHFHLDAHDERTGAPTIDLGQVLNPRLPPPRQIKFGGDFEGYVRARLGLRDRVGFRVFPPRVVIDVGHQPSRRFGTATVTRSGTAAEILVTGVRAGRHPGCDRLVFDVKGAELPTLRAGYVGTGSTIEVTFEALGSLTVSPHATHAGPGTVAIGMPELRAVSFIVRGAGVMTAHVTTTRRHGFRVLLLRAPTRVVLDVAH